MPNNDRPFPPLVGTVTPEEHGRVLESLDEFCPLSREELSARHDGITKIIDRIEEIYETSRIEGASGEQRRRWLRTMIYRAVFQ